MIIDMHCDTISALRDIRKHEIDQTLLDNDKLQISLRKLKQSDYGIQNFAVFTNLGECEDPFDDAMEQITLFHDEMEQHKEWIQPVVSFREMEENRRAGKLSALLTLEEGGICGGDFDKLKVLYGKGARMLTICWNYENELGYGTACLPEHADIFHKEKPDKVPESYGLKRKGFEFVEVMEELGIIPDVSHLSDEGFWDVCKISRKPFVASHSNARTVCNHPRNLTDQMIRRMGELGCVAGLNFYPSFLGDARMGNNYLEAIAAHAAHMISVGGSEVVGIGTDFDGFSGDCSPKDSSKMILLEDAFRKAGLNNSQIEGILYKNVWNLYRETL